MQPHSSAIVSGISIPCRISNSEMTILSISGLAAFVSPMIRSLVTGTVNANSNVNPVTLLGSIAAIESFCDFAVPFAYPVAFDWLISIHKAPFIFFLGAVFYLLAGLTIVVCGKRMRRGVVED